MCQAIPRQVLQVATDRVQVLYDGVPTWVAANGIPDLTVGKYVIVYAGQAIEQLSADEAEEILRFYDELDRMVQEAAG